MEFVRTMRHLFIINPAAGKRRTTARLEVELDKLSVPHEVVYTQAAGDARRFAEEAVQTGEPVRIYACGGDGTLNEVVNGAAGHTHAAITNVPTGTGNDFLKGRNIVTAIPLSDRWNMANVISLLADLMWL